MARFWTVLSGLIDDVKECKQYASKSVRHLASTEKEIHHH